MKKIMLIPLLLGSNAAAQWVQNSDISILFGACPSGAQSVAGSGLAVDGGVGSCSGTLYGYQLARLSAASLWIEGSPGYFLLGGVRSGAAGTVNNDIHAYFAGLRIMVPLQSRVSLYAVSGGGGGSFHYPVVSGATKPFLSSNDTTHGVFEFGGGVDIRLSRMFSIRPEIRDFVSGKGLSGASGRHHIFALAGITAHF